MAPCRNRRRGCWPGWHSSSPVASGGGNKSALDSSGTLLGEVDAFPDIPLADFGADRFGPGGRRADFVSPCRGPAPDGASRSRARGDRALTTAVFVQWRLLGTEPPDTAFNVYRVTDDGEPVRLNRAARRTDAHSSTATPTRAKKNAWFVRPVVEGRELAAVATVRHAGRRRRPALSVDPHLAAGRLSCRTTLRSAIWMATASTKSSSTWSAAAATIRRTALRPSRSSTPTASTARVCGGSTSARTFAKAPTTRSSWSTTWTATAGPSSPAKRPTAPSTARATAIGDANADYRNDAGRILDGPEFLTVFDGLTGAALATADYIPPRGDVAAWGDDRGNRGDRFLACIAYLDGQRPSLVMCRGYYTRCVLAAWNWRDGKLTHVWTFDSDDGTPGNEAYRGQGNHGISVGDVDADGRDEIIYGSCVIDDNGRGLYSTGLGHGDAMHFTDIDPDRPGLEVFKANGDGRNPAGIQLRDAAHRRTTLRHCRRPNRAASPGPSHSTSTRAIADWKCGASTRRSRAADGEEAGGGRRRRDGESAGRLHSATRTNVAPESPQPPAEAESQPRPESQRSPNRRRNRPRPGRNRLLRRAREAHLREDAADRATWASGGTATSCASFWTAFASRNGTMRTSRKSTCLDGADFDCASNNGSKSNPCLCADILGDWREEIVARTRDNRELRIFVTTIPTERRLVTLMHDPIYRLGVAWQNVSYNQPAHPGFYLGHGMPEPPRPNIAPTPLVQSER